jgi:hypothetical protein
MANFAFIKNEEFNKEIEPGGKGFDLISSLYPEGVEIGLKFTADIYHQDACTFGEPEKCSPEEGGDERLFTCAVAYPDGWKFPVDLPNDIGEKMFELFEQDIYAQDVEMN